MNNPAHANRTRQNKGYLLVQSSSNISGCSEQNFDFFFIFQYFLKTLNHKGSVAVLGKLKRYQLIYQCHSYLL